jgi:hypothetical protein
MSEADAHPDAAAFVREHLDRIQRGQIGGVEVTLRTYHVFTVREGLIVRNAMSGEREEMLRVAGIESR